MNYRVSIDEDLCKGVDGCGLCIHICPKKVYEKAGHLTDRGVYPPEAVRLDQCTGCKLCVMYCPDLAIVVETDDNTLQKAEGRRQKAEGKV